MTAQNLISGANGVSEPPQPGRVSAGRTVGRQDGGTFPPTPLHTCWCSHNDGICPRGGTCTALGTREHTGVRQSETLHQRPSISRGVQGKPKAEDGYGTSSLPPAPAPAASPPHTCAAGGGGEPYGSLWPWSRCQRGKGYFKSDKVPAGTGRLRSSTRLASSLGWAKSCPNGVPQGRQAPRPTCTPTPGRPPARPSAVSARPPPAGSRRRALLKPSSAASAAPFGAPAAERNSPTRSAG